MVGESGGEPEPGLLIFGYRGDLAFAGRHGECLSQPLGRLGEKGICNGSTVPSHIDGVHDGESTADAEGEAEKEADQRSGETHVSIMSWEKRRTVTGQEVRFSDAMHRVSVAGVWRDDVPF